MLQNPTSLETSTSTSPSPSPPPQHPAKPILPPRLIVGAPTSTKQYGIHCSSGSAAADRRCLTIHGPFDPGWPVDALQVTAEAKHAVPVQTQHGPAHSFPCEQPQKSAASRTSYVCSRYLRQILSTAASCLLIVFDRGYPRQRQRACARPFTISIPRPLSLDI